MADYYGEAEPTPQQQYYTQSEAQCTPEGALTAQQQHSYGAAATEPMPPTAPFAYNPYAIPPATQGQQESYDSALYSDRMHEPLSNYYNESRRFVPGKCQDSIWAVLFLLQLFAIIGASVFCYDRNEEEFRREPHGMANRHFWVLLAAITALAMASAGFWLLVAKRYAANLIWIAIGLSIAFHLLVALSCFDAGSILLGTVFMAITALLCAWAYFVRHRIEFAAAVLRLAISALNKMPSVYLISVLSLFLQAVWVIIWMTGVAFVLYDFDKRGKHVPGAVVFLFLVSFFWTAQVVSNVVHVTAAGAVATWYFSSMLPANVVLGSLKRAATTSFGSICFGSLLIAVIQATKFLVDSAKKSKHKVARACVSCVLSCLERIMEYFNLYAFSRVAIYGMSYLQSAKETWQLFKAKGMDAVINDDLIGGVLMICCLMSGAMSALMACILTDFISNSKSWQLWTALAFILGMAMTLCAMIVVRSGVATIFVCFAEDPKALADTKPAQYELLVHAWTKRYGKVPSRLTEASTYSYST